MSAISLLGVEVPSPIGIGNAITLSDSKVFRAVNTHTAAVKITIVDSSDQVIGNTTLVSGGSQLFTKRASDKVFSTNAGLLLTPTAYPVG